MPYTADVIKIMIASPSDVGPERQIVRDVIRQWNYINSETRHLVLMPVGWESHSYPEMGARAQELINSQVLRDSDFLIAVFWTRLGTPTGSSPSGTVEEIEEHMATGKPTMIYFSQAPIHPDSVDPEQYSALKTFKEECKRRGLIETYESLGEFRDKLFRQLSQVVIKAFRSNESIPDVVESQNPYSKIIGNLSTASRELLLETGNDPNGIIIRVRTLGGLRVQTNNKNFVEPKSPRSEARWQGAIDQLSTMGLIEDRSHKGEVFALTDTGYMLIDYLKEN